MNQAISWLIVDDVPNANIGYRAIVESDGTTVCNPSPMGEDNARLIAAAPDLLAVLAELTQAVEDEGVPCMDCLTTKARAAIAKAEGAA